MFFLESFRLSFNHIALKTTCCLVVFLLGVPAPLPAPPSGFPLYLCSLRYHFAPKGCRSNP